MAVKLTDLAKKLKLTKLQLRRKLKSLDFDGLDPKKSFFEKKIADQILAELSNKRPPLKKKKSRKKPEKEEKNLIFISETVTVKNFASKMNLPVTDIIKELLRNGLSVTINEKIDFETASIIASDFGFKVKKPRRQEKKAEEDWQGKRLRSRPPVVTILGHVDHGKTTLLDRIRKASVVSGESGGITQHIGAYQVEAEIDGKKRKITFIDTPGHKAFTAMRAQGAKVTDIAVLIIAADDSVKPQTKEALDHIKEAGVPVVVAINKIDLPNADVDKTKKDLVEIGLTPEELGGTTPVIEISAKKGTNVDELLEMIILTADLQDLKAPYEDAVAKGVVIESHQHKGAGVLATVLIKQGILKQNDALIAGTIPATARIMEDETMRRVKEAVPSQPVRIIGFEEVPAVGTIIEKVKDIKTARRIAKKRREIMRKEGRPSGSGLVEAAKSIKKGRSKQLRIILKTDVAGSLEAIQQSIENLGGDKTQVNIIRAGVGLVNESDIEMAIAGKAIIISFRMGIDRAAETLARQNGIEILKYDVIYRLIDDLQAALEGMLGSKIVRKDLAKAKVLKIFFTSQKRKIIGCRLLKGRVERSAELEIVRADKRIGEAKIVSLQIEQKEVDQVKGSQEFGISVESGVKIKEGDELRFFVKKKVVQKLESK